MRRAYVITGELEPGVPDKYWAVCHSMDRAEDLCLQAEKEDPTHMYTWHEVIDEED